MLEQYTEELQAVRAAIMRLTADPSSSQSVSSANGGSYSCSYMDIGKLYAREQYLVSQIAALSRGGSMSVSYPIYCGG